MGGEIKSVYRLLLKEYGEQGWWPINNFYSRSFKKRKRTPEERFEIAVGAILTQNTSWENAKKALHNLREADALSGEEMGKLREEELARLIKPARYYNMKAKKLREFLRYDGPPERERMLGIWGIGPETVDSMLLYAWGKPEFMIDAYTKRIFSRLGMCPKDVEYEELKKMFEENLPEDAALYNEYHALIVKHAQEHCRARPACRGCPLENICEKKGIERQ
ncbi:endonuclease [Candidatus Micrarchaeota archaeon]|nr:endonuclease [Candidatus Micrarchaeota archaeon]